MSDTEKILACDGALGALSLAYDDGQTCLLRHAAGNDALERGIALIDELLTAAGIAVADLTALACTIGPGAFTSLRITLAMAKGLAFSLDLPLVAVSSFDALREMLVTPILQEPLLLALRPRPGIFSFRVVGCDGEIRAAASGPAADALQTVRPFLHDVRKIVAWPPSEAQQDIAGLEIAMDILALRDEAPAFAVARLARRRLALDRPALDAVHAIVADYGEAPATTVVAL
jgi:tRNA threonylcarbamoyl adenosine modification protein YeaZ